MKFRQPLVLRQIYFKFLVEMVKMYLVVGRLWTPPSRPTLKLYNTLITHSFPILPFSTPWKHQKSLRFSGGRERLHWELMVQQFFPIFKNMSRTRRSFFFFNLENVRLAIVFCIHEINYPKSKIARQYQKATVPNSRSNVFDNFTIKRRGFYSWPFNPKIKNTLQFSILL